MRKLLPVAMLVFIAGVVCVGAAVGPKAPTPSADSNGAVVPEYSLKPIPLDDRYANCLCDCDIAQETPGSGGKCNVKFSAFHKPWGGNDCPCSDHSPPDEVVFCYRESGSLYWCYDTTERGPQEYSPLLDCDGYYYYSPWLELDDATSTSSAWKGAVARIRSM